MSFAVCCPERQQSARSQLMLPHVGVSAPLGAALACDSGENDVQQSMVAQMDLDTMLVFAQACRGGQKAAAMRLQQVATLAQLSGVPSAGWFRRADKGQYCRLVSGSKFIIHRSNWNHSDIRVINFLIMWGIKEMERAAEPKQRWTPWRVGFLDSSALLTLLPFVTAPKPSTCPCSRTRGLSLRRRWRDKRFRPLARSSASS